MQNTPSCPECGAALPDGGACQDDFNQMLAWEMEDLERFGSVHHLMVLSYHLQHPSRYSPAGLTYAKGLLVDFLEKGLSPQNVRQANSAQVDSGKRKWKVTGTPESYGQYTHPVAWTMTARDVVAAGQEGYCENVRQWARNILETLKKSGNLE